MRGCLVFLALGIAGGIGYPLVGRAAGGDLSALLPLTALAAATAALVLFIRTRRKGAADDGSTSVAAAAAAAAVDGIAGSDDSDDSDDGAEEGGNGGNGDRERGGGGRVRNRVARAGLVLFIGMFPVLFLLALFEAASWLAPYAMGAGGVGFALSLFGDGGSTGGDGGDGGGE
ncbi:hypothetical protein OUQ99_19585 [Streptomonospora nanhaiensis]|uniref:Uncharacterized protein n=1 Tax=Streptomonospora nanhaiensis TaxID=1323731 RepID=A0ABY6YGW2_9ACTN|nr:hypothetical protein [Streptomonospora nanhaiensis]WAE71432.1 hypothetical protein OUQ99_19585 [Streptomonospora nanhaiensis]